MRNIILVAALLSCSIWIAPHLADASAGVTTGTVAKGTIAEKTKRPAAKRAAAQIALPNYTVAQAVKMALHNSESLKASAYGVRGAEATKQSAFSRFLPNLSAKYNEQKLYDAEYHLSRPQLPTYKAKLNGLDLGKSASLNVEQNIFNSFADIHGIRSADAGLASQRIRHKNDQAAVISRAVEAYQDVLFIRLKEDLVQQRLRLMEKNSSEAAIKWEKGLINGTDLEEAKAQLSMAQAQIILVNVEKNDVERVFIQLIGIEPPAVINKIDPAKIIIPSDLPLAEQTALAKNKTLLYLRKQHEKSVHDTNARISSLGPRVDAFAAVHHNNVEFSRNIYGGNKIGVQVTVPIFQGGVEYAGIKAAKSQQESAYHLLRDENRKVVTQVHHYWYALKSNVAKIQAYQAEIAARSAQVEALKSEYAVGIKTMMDLIRGEVDLFDSRLRMLQEESARVKLLVDIKYLIGELEEVDFVQLG